MSERDQLLEKARQSRKLARRVREMSGFLTQHADVERMRAYAGELEARALELERTATDRIAKPAET